MQETRAGTETATDLQETSCVVIGGGQIGAMLSLLLSRSGVPVRRLESYADFRRDPARDGILPAVKEILEQLGSDGEQESPRNEPGFPTLLVVPAGPATPGGSEPAALESPAESGDERAAEKGDGKSQYELGRAQGRIEFLEQEIRRREQEIVNLRKPRSGGNPQS